MYAHVAYLCVYAFVYVSAGLLSTGAGSRLGAYRVDVFGAIFLWHCVAARCDYKSSGLQVSIALKHLCPPLKA